MASRAEEKRLRREERQATRQQEGAPQELTPIEHVAILCACRACLVENVLASLAARTSRLRAMRPEGETRGEGGEELHPSHHVVDPVRGLPAAQHVCAADAPMRARTGRRIFSWKS